MTEIHIQYGGGYGEPPQKQPDQGGQEALVILVVLLLIGGGIWLFMSGKMPDLGSKSEDTAAVKVNGVPDFTKPCQPAHKDRTKACQLAKAYAYAKLAPIYKEKSELNKQFKCLDRLWINESGWDDHAENPSSGALGIPQALGHGVVYKKGEWKKQIDWGVDYITTNRPKTFNTPCEALAFWNRTDPRPHPGHWY